MFWSFRKPNVQSLVLSFVVQGNRSLIIQKIHTFDQELIPANQMRLWMKYYPWKGGSLRYCFETKTIAIKHFIIKIPSEKIKFSDKTPANFWLAHWIYLALNYLKFVELFILWFDHKICQFKFLSFKSDFLHWIKRGELLNPCRSLITYPQQDLLSYNGILGLEISLHIKQKNMLVLQSIFLRIKDVRQVKANQGSTWKPFLKRACWRAKNFYSKPWGLVFLEWIFLDPIFHQINSTKFGSLLEKEKTVTVKCHVFLSGVLRQLWFFWCLNKLSPLLGLTFHKDSEKSVYRRGEEKIFDEQTYVSFNKESITS